MAKKFVNQYLTGSIYKHKELPLLVSNEFSFFRCIAFDEGFYGKTVSELHHGNIRRPDAKSRYSMLFNSAEVSYWADSPKTARAEVKYHKKTNSLITFWAYDDATSTFPTTDNYEPLFIVDGRDLGFADVLEKIDKGEKLSSEDEVLIRRINNMNPDCLAYESKRYKRGVNFMFFEKGFKKLSLREVRLRLGDKKSQNTACITCADTSDYAPSIESYGFYFDRTARVKYNQDYKNSVEYLSRNAVYRRNMMQFLKQME